MQKSISILISAFIILLPFGLQVFDGAFREQEIILCSCFLFLACLFGYCVFSVVKCKCICLSFSFLDLSVLLFFVYSALHLFFLKHLQVGETLIYKWLAVFCCYVVCRILPCKNILLYAIVLSGVVQSVIVILQKLYLLDSYNSFFDITGTFFNPGRLGGYLAVALAVTIGVLRNAVKNKLRIHVVFLSISALLLCIALVLSDSRAAFIGVFAGIFVCFYSEIRSVFIKRKTLFATIFFVVMVLLGLFLFNYRKGSANSRLFTWRVSTDMICNKPVFGHGITSFEQKYMHYQAAYFAENENSKFISIADNVPYAYNEFIHITVEMGILGLLFLLAIFYLAFSVKGQLYIKSALAALLAFSFFSYPAEVFPLLLMFPVVLAQMNSKILKTINLSRIIAVIFCAVLLFAIYVNLKSELYFHKASNQFPQIDENNEQTNNYVLTHYKRLQYYPEFCKIYTIWLANNTSENELFNALELFPSSENYCFFGELYIEKEMYSKAEECFKIAALMTPNRILPNYNLFKLYQKSGDKTQAAAMANKIINQPIKIENTQTIRIRFEAEKYLSSP